MINENIHNRKPFLHCSFFNFRVKLYDLSCELCVGLEIYVLNLIWYQSLGRTRQFSHYRSILGWKKTNWEKMLLPLLHQKWRIYQLISKVKELLIKIAWSITLGVKEIQKVQIADLILSIWLCDLQVISYSHCICYKHLILLTAFATTAKYSSKWPLQ